MNNPLVVTKHEDVKNLYAQVQELQKRVEALENMPVTTVELTKEITEEELQSIKEKYQRYTAEVLPTISFPTATAKAINLSQELEYMRAEVERLKRGDFTPEELQNLCHNLTEEKKEEFFKGCCDYQNKLFKCNAVDEEMERCIKIVENFSAWIGKVNANKLVHSIRQR